MFDEEGVLDTMECLAVPVGTVQGNNKKKRTPLGNKIENWQMEVIRTIL